MAMFIFYHPFIDLYKLSIESIKFEEGRYVLSHFSDNFLYISLSFIKSVSSYLHIADDPSVFSSQNLYYHDHHTLHQTLL